MYAIARYIISTVRLPSVCLSVRLSHEVDQSKTVEVTIMRFSLQSSPVTLVNVTTKFKREHGTRAPNKRAVGKMRNFQLISRRISETVQDRTKLLLTNRKSHMRF